jgi:hypothetical protein
MERLTGTWQGLSATLTSSDAHPSSWRVQEEPHQVESRFQNRPDLARRVAASGASACWTATATALVFYSIRTGYKADRELCNNATPSQCAKTTACSCLPVVTPRDSGIIMQQSHRDKCYSHMTGLSVVQPISNAGCARRLIYGFCSTV